MQKMLFILCLFAADFLHAAANNKPVAVIPFEFTNGEIILKAKVNNSDKELRLLFDTGADGMAMNGSLADSLGLTVARSQEASVVGGVMKIDISSHNTYHFGGFDLPEQNIGIFRNNQLNVDGIVGIGLARNYVVSVDFDRQVMELYEPDGYTPPQKSTAVPMILKGGTPMLRIRLKAGRKEAEGDFVFDTGANYNIILFGPFVKANLLLTSGFDPYASGSTLSMGQASASFTGYIDWLQIDSIRLQQVPGTLQAFRPGDEKWARAGAGSLGIKLISHWNFVMNLPKQLFYLTPGKSFDAAFEK